MRNSLDLSAILTTLQHERPLVQCITNYVAMNICANVMLAAGASPAMVHSQEESGEFAPIARALTINIGTLSPDWVTGMKVAINAANQHSKPWVLDPVAHFATRFRSAVTDELLDLKPAVIRGNASEIISLAGHQSKGSGADSGDTVETAIEAAKDLAARRGTVVAVTGERDFVTDGTRGMLIHGGSPIMPKITALGCALTGLTGAFLAIHTDHLEATVAALSLFATCGTRAGAQSNGPGSFQVAFLDQLSLITPSEFAQNARIDVA